MLTEGEMHTLHQIGLGRHTPTSDKSRARFDRFVEMGLAGFNPAGGRDGRGGYFITDAGCDLLTERS